MALDQASVSFLQAAAEAADPNAKPMWEMTPQQVRDAQAAGAVPGEPGPAMYRTENHVFKGADGGEFQVRVHRPTENPHSVLVYLHGGGWVLSDIDEFDKVTRMLAEQSGATIVMANYRKAPEHPFPTPVEDSWITLKWAADNLGELAMDGAPLYVAGDSAGGNLASVMALRAKERGGPQIARQILIYPVCDADFERPSYLSEENQTLLPTPFMQWFWDHYIPNPEDRKHPDAAPIHAEDLSGVAPALVITAAHDVLCDEGVAYSERLKADGVEVEYHNWPGQMHGFFGFCDIFPAANEVVELIARSISDNSNETAKAGA